MYSPSEFPHPAKSKQNNEILFTTNFFNKDKASNLFPALQCKYTTHGQFITFPLSSTISK